MVTTDLNAPAHRDESAEAPSPHDFLPNPCPFGHHIRSAEDLRACDEPRSAEGAKAAAAGGCVLLAAGDA